MQVTFDSFIGGFTRISQEDEPLLYTFDQSVILHTTPVINKEVTHIEHDMMNLYFFGEIGREMGVSHSVSPSITVSKKVAASILVDKDTLYMFRPRDFLYTRNISSNLKMLGSASDKYEPSYNDISAFINNIAYSDNSEFGIGPSSGWFKVLVKGSPCMVNIAQYVCGNVQIVSIVNEIVSHRIFRLQQDGEIHVSAAVNRCFDGYFIEAIVAEVFEPSICVKISPDTSISINKYTILPDEQPRVFIDRAVNFQLNDVMTACNEAFLQTEYSHMLPVEQDSNDLENLNFEADLLFSQQNTNPYCQ
jgi:hypothetical protein